MLPGSTFPDLSHEKVLILGVNGFIGHHLTERILSGTDWHVYGMDMSDHRLGDLVSHPRMHFLRVTSRSTGSGLNITFASVM